MPIPLGILAVAGAGAGGASSYELIESVILTGSQASITFSNINQSYKHLQIRAVSRQAAGSWATCFLTFNGDTGANYASHFLFGSGSAVSSSAQINRNNILSAGSTDSGQTSGIFAPSVIDILDFSSPSKNTTVRTMTAYSGSLNWILMRSGFWNNTAAVTSLTLTPESGSSIAAGSRFSLYGIR